MLADANHYDPQLTDGAGEAADGTYVRTASTRSSTPRRRRTTPRREQYLELIDQYDPGGKIANLGVQGLSSWLLFAKAANECGAELTRDCVWEKAQAITEWTGGGLHAPQNLADGRGVELLRVARRSRAAQFVLDEHRADRRHLQLRRRQRRRRSPATTGPAPSARTRRTRPIRSRRTAREA